MMYYKDANLWNTNLKRFTITGCHHHFSIVDKNLKKRKKAYWMYLFVSQLSHDNVCNSLPNHFWRSQWSYTNSIMIVNTTNLTFKNFSRYWVPRNEEFMKCENELMEKHDIHAFTLLHEDFVSHFLVSFGTSCKLALMRLVYS